MKRSAIRAFVFLLSLGLVLQAAFPLGVDIAYAASDSVWKPLADIDAAVSSGKSIAVTMTTSDGDTFALPAAATSSAPTAKSASIQSDELFISGSETEYGWTITKAGDTYTLQNSGDKYLYLTANNNGVRVGNLPTTGGTWKLTASPSPIYLNADASDATRYLGVYNKTDWRCYTSPNSNNIKDQTLKFWAYDRDESAPDPTLVPISDALAASSGEFFVKGVVTLIDGSNAYIQDATGAICVRAASAISGIAVGDTIKATGTRETYRTLPQLNKSTYEKVTDPAEQITLSAKATTIDSLTTSDVCKYVTITDLTVQTAASSGANITVKDAGGNSIEIRKIVLSSDLNAGDVITFTGAVGVFDSTLQLQNTNADEIVVTSAAPVLPSSSFGLASSIADGDEVILYNAANGVGLGNSMSSTKVAGVSLAPSAGVIETNSDAVIWTVQENSDGTYSFKQGSNILGGKANGTNANLVLTGADRTDFTLDGPDSSDFNYYLKFADWGSSYGKFHLEYYNGWTLYASNDPSKAAFGVTFYKKGAAPETPTPLPKGDLITDLSELTDGMTIAIYNDAHKTAVSSKPNGDWYLKAKEATITSEGKLETFTADYIWKVKLNSDGTYSFYANDDDTKSITAWKSGNYAELCLDVDKYPDNKWEISAATTENSFYMKSPTVFGTNGPAYIEAYLRNGHEVYSGYFVQPTSSTFKESEFALKFYKVDPADASAAYDDGVWDGVMNPGSEYLIFNGASKTALGIYKEANGTLDPIVSETTSETPPKLKAGNGAYVFTVDSMGRYYTFKHNGKYLATNDKEVLFFEDPLSGGEAPENAKWFLTPLDDGYIIYNKDASYGGTPVCIEYYSSAFSGWTYNPKAEDKSIFRFNFYEPAAGTKIYNGTVQDPTVLFDCKSTRCIEQDFPVTVSLDDLCPDITSATITYTAGSKSGSIDTENALVCEVSSDKKNYTFTIPAADIDSAENPSTLVITVAVTNSYGIDYTSSKTVDILDEPFIEDVTPAPGSQTGDNKKPVISARVGNVGDNPQFTLKLNDEVLSGFEYSGGIFSYTPQDNIIDGRKTAVIEVKRADDVSTSKTWNFTVGDADYQQYFGQLHSHTTYSDGTGTLESALDYIESLPESANVQFVAFTDHSNYFDSASAANPEDSLNDKSKMTAASKALWEEYQGKAASFNAKQSKVIALSGFEMTWSGGPGHINTFQSEGLVSRNNAALNNKTGDAGMKLYYKALNEGDSISQFNHPGSTFGNFADFSYWDEETDNHIYLVEVGNGEGQIGAGGYYPSYEQYTLALDKGWHLAPTNNQDNHKGRWGNANDARDVVLTNDFSEQGIFDAIRALRVYSTEDKNLKLSYTVNGEPMGTVFSDVPDKLELEVTTFDPDLEDKISKVEVIANGGKVVHTWNNSEDIEKGYFTTELNPDYTYYYIRTTQEDGNLAVTAPVWTGKSAAMGIDNVIATPDVGVVNEEMTLTTTLSNKTDAEAKLKSLTYSIGSQVIASDSTERSLSAGASIDVDAKITPTVAKITTVTVTAVISSGGSTYTFSKDITFSVRANNDPLAVVPISTVQAQTESGFEYAIEGVVTSNASGYDKDTAFFDCIYVQDETAGICCFPVSGDFKIGDKVHIEGHTDFYQGEMELQVASIDKIGEGTVDPTEVTAEQINDKSVLGSLVTLKGVVESVEVSSGLIQNIMVRDAAGNIARVFIDGYITVAKDVENCIVGAEITVTGLASYDDTFNAPTGPFPRIRVRDRKDVICVVNNLDEYKAQALAELNAVNIKDYSYDELSNVLDAIADAKAAIEAAGIADEVTAAMDAANAVINAQMTNAEKLQQAKDIANTELNAVNLAQYSGGALEAVKKAVADAKEAIEGATTVEAVNLALAKANAVILTQSSGGELDGAKKLARTQLGAIDKSQYSGAELAAVEAALAAAAAEIDAAKSIDAINAAIVKANAAIATQKTDAQKADENAAKVTTVTVNVKMVDAAALDAAVAAAGGSKKYVTTVVLGKKVKKIKASTFAEYQNVQTLSVKTRKLSKKSVKASLKGSAVKTVKVKVGSKKVNKKFVKKYKKVFTKKNAGKKAAVQ